MSVVTCALLSHKLLHMILKWHGGTVISTVTSQEGGSGFQFWLARILSVWNFHVLSVLVWVFSGCSDFLRLLKYVD